ncbi:hypothetical protein HPB48_016264 [Haemaphysalis longicornis]|uniref:Uncharacterized protein n=1 Tax=Haemaphysalis longicornis TaxID=44386 RepID=A0A9J6GWD8_HAELO|nr:hypothetical protein HPB48_016264 [Haemaphysalis longicornis]
MNVAGAIQIFSLAVTAALEHLREQAGHICSSSFATAGHTSTFMRNFYPRFILLYTSNTTQHLRKKFHDVWHYDDADDDMFKWLEATMPMYGKDKKKGAATKVSCSRRKHRGHL